MMSRRRTTAVFTKVFQWEDVIQQPVGLDAYGTMAFSLADINASQGADGSPDLDNLSTLYTEFKICSITSTWVPSLKTQVLDCPRVYGVEAVQASPYQDRGLCFAKTYDEPRLQPVVGRMQELRKFFRKSIYQRFTLTHPLYTTVNRTYITTADNTVTQYLPLRAQWMRILAGDQQYTYSLVKHGYMPYVIRGASTEPAANEGVVYQTWTRRWRAVVKFRNNT